MGMFDRIECHYPIEPAPVREWQTKDTPSLKLKTYTITASGMLTLDGELVPFNGPIVFYGSEGRRLDLWWEYRAEFDCGKLVSMELLKRRSTEVPDG
jgi:hypothetical protein